MKKHTLCLLLVLLLAVTLIAGCGGKEDEPAPPEEQTEPAEDEEQPEEDQETPEDEDKEEEKEDKDKKDKKESKGRKRDEERFGLTTLDFSELSYSGTPVRFYGFVEAPFSLNTAAAYFEELTLGGGKLDPLDYRGLETPVGETDLTGTYAIRGGLSKGTFAVLGAPPAEEKDEDKDDPEEKEEPEVQTLGEQLEKGNFVFYGWYDPELLFGLGDEKKDSYTTEDLDDLLDDMLETFGAPSKVYYFMPGGDDQREATFVWNRGSYGFTLTLNDYYYEKEEKLSLVECAYYGEEAIARRVAELEALINGYS